MRTPGHAPRLRTRVLALGLAFWAEVLRVWAFVLGRWFGYGGVARPDLFVVAPFPLVSQQLKAMMGSLRSLERFLLGSLNSGPRLLLRIPGLSFPTWVFNPPK